MQTVEHGVQAEVLVGSFADGTPEVVQSFVAGGHDQDEKVLTVVISLETTITTEPPRV